MADLRGLMQADAVARAGRRQQQRRRPEHEHQAALVERCRRSAGRWPQLRLLHAIPNGAHVQQHWVEHLGEWDSGKAERTKLLREGMLQGIPDLFLPYPAGGYHGCYVEMKSVGNYATPVQREVHRQLMAAGYLVLVERDHEAAWASLTAYVSGQTRREGTDQ